MRWLCDLGDAADVGESLAVGNQLLGGRELADDLFRCVPGASYGRLTALV